MKFQIKKFETIDSTNSYTLQNADTLEDFTVISAAQQTKGRGRKGREWLSPSGDNLYFTLLIKNPEIDLKQLSSLPQLMALAVNQMLKQCGLKNSWIKWPNDVFINDAKICGVLCESKIQAGKLTALAIGVGVNINTSVEALSSLENTATSMLIETPDMTPYQADETLHFILMKFKDNYTIWQDAKKRDQIVERWRQASRLIGQQVVLKDDQRLIYGTAIDFTQSGEIIIQTEKGFQTFSYGDLSLRLV